MNYRIYFILGILATILLFMWMLLANSLISSEQKDLNNLQIRMDKLDQEQKSTRDLLEHLPTIDPGIVGKASYYDYVLESGWSSVGHRVCASRDFPRGSILKVVNLANKKSVECKVTDYGPAKAVHPDRIVDLSSYSFSQLASTKLGIINVSIERIQ